MVIAGGARMRSSVSHGVGLAIGRDAQNRCVVTRVLPGGAAAFSGQVFQGDIIVDIDSFPTARIPETEIAQWFVGEAGTLVTLGLMSDSVASAKRQVRLTRQPISAVGASVHVHGLESSTNRSFSPARNRLPADYARPPVQNGSAADELAGIGAVLASDVNGNLVRHLSPYHKKLTHLLIKYKY